MNWPSAFWWYSHAIPIIPSGETELWETTTSRTCRLSRLSGLNSHEFRWEGLNFEVISTDLLWTGYEAGKIWAILSEGHDAKCHQRAGSTCWHCFPRYGLITYDTFVTLFYHSLPRWSLQGCNYKVVRLHLETYLSPWGIGARLGGKNTLGHRTKRFHSGIPCLKSVLHNSPTIFGAILTGTEWELLARLPSFKQIFFYFILDIVASKQMFLLCGKNYPKPCQIHQFWCK